MASFAAFGNDLYTGRRSIDFIGRRRTWYTIGVIMVSLSLLALIVLKLNLGLEFKGGSQFEILHVSDTSQQIGQDAVGTIVSGGETPHVVKLGTSGIRISTERLSDTQTDQVKQALAKAYGANVQDVTSSFVGPSWGQDVSKKALQGLIAFMVLVSLVITLYFRTWKMAASALIALVHDLIITVGVYAILRFEVTPASVIGFLTILGYSLYDTVVVFDKVRENTADVVHSTRRSFAEAANMAVNQTLVRSINTSVVALLPVGSILFIGSFLLGAGTLKDISLALFVGIAAGTYSSIFIATPLLVDLRRNEPDIAAHTVKIERRRAEVAARADHGTPDSASGSSLLDRDDDLLVTQPVTSGAPSWNAPASSGRGVPGAGSANGRPGRAAGQSAGQSAGEADGQGAGRAQRQQPKRGKSRPGGRRR